MMKYPIVKEIAYTTPNNIPMRNWRRILPRINRRILDCTIYLYPNETAARNGVQWGGAGFLMAVPYQQDIEGKRRSHIYAVTNSHVVREAKATVIRLNRIEGQSEVLNKQYGDWIDDWDEDDLAVCMLDDTIMSRFRWLAPLPDSVIGDDLMRGTVDIGTDVVTIARFIAHDGKQENLPVALFGHIAMLNWQPIRHRDRPVLRQESFLIDSKAIAGTSGSPVFLLPIHPGDVTNLSADLLGIVWGYGYTREPIRRKKKDEEFQSLYVMDNTGMMYVIPAWKLMKFLDRSDLMEQRKRIEQEAIEEAENSAGGAASAAVQPDDNEPIDEKPYERQDFIDALDKAIQPIRKKRGKGKSETSA